MKALDLGHPNVLATVFKLTLPAMLAQFINVLYSVVDRIYVGNIEGIGDTVLAGVGVCAPISTLITSFAYLIGLGGAPLFAMSLGEGRQDNAKKILSNAFIALVALAALVTVCMLTLRAPMLMTFGASENTYEYAEKYLIVCAAGALFPILATGLNQFIIAQGYSGIGMATTAIGAAANIALDPLFIFVFDMDAAGAAAATVLSQFLSCAFVLIFLRLKNTKVRLTFRKPSTKVIFKTINLGLSPFIIIATDSVIIIVSNAMLKHYGGEDGDMWITVSTVVQAFFCLITMLLLGISTGSQPVLSFNYGAKNAALIERAEKIILGMCLAFTGLMFGLSFAIAAPFVSLFTDNAVIAQKSVWGIRMYMIGVIPLAFQYAFVDGLTALGQPQYAITLSMARKLVVYLGCTIVLPAFFGIQAVFFAEPACDVVSAVVSTSVFLAVLPKILKKRLAAPERSIL